MCTSHLCNTIFSLNEFFILSSKHTVRNAVLLYHPCFLLCIYIIAFFFSVSFFLFHRSLTSNLPNLPNVNLQMPKVPNLPVSVNLRPMQMPSFSTPNWIPGLSETECVLSLYWILIHACVALASTFSSYFIFQFEFTLN